MMSFRSITSRGGRRPALPALLCAFALGFGNAAAHASGNDARSPVAAEPQASGIVQDYLASWNAHDRKGMARLYAPDITYFNTSRPGVTLRGAPAVIDVFDQLTRFMPDIHWRLVSAPVAGPEGVAFEWRVSGTVAAPPGASEAATPRAIDVRGATVLKVEGGRIVYLADYYNGLTMYEQMGQAPDVKPLR